MSDLDDIPIETDPEQWRMVDGRPAYVAKRLRGELQSSAQRLSGEPIRREALTRNILSYGVQFLDDQLGALCSHDLVLVGASTGAGKTQLATHIALSNAQAGRRVAFFALEAEEDEIERRLEYQVFLHQCRSEGVPGMRYVDWYCRRFSSGQERAAWAAHEELIKRIGSLSTYYRTGEFTIASLVARMEASAADFDLFVVDHLHYIDTIGDDELREMRDITARIRDVALKLGRPVILLAHLRKRQGGPRGPVVPDLDDFHGSSNVSKIATHAVMLARAPFDPACAPTVRRTLMHCPKDRRDGPSGYVALLEYDAAIGAYRAKYQLGRAVGDAWRPVPSTDAPAWARHHTELVTGDLKP